MKQITNNWIVSLLNQNHKIQLVGTCHDCKTEVIIDIDKVKDDFKMFGGLVWKYDEIEKPFFKCPKCSLFNSKLTNYMPTEIYSRVCGYLRPVKQWNIGKQEEFKMRKGFKGFE